MEPAAQLDRDTALLASTLGVFEVKYKVRANATSEWQERSYTVAHMAGIALTDNEAAAELIVLAVRHGKWRQYCVEGNTADYLLSSIDAVIDMTPVNSRKLQKVLERNADPKNIPVQSTPMKLRERFSGVIQNFLTAGHVYSSRLPDYPNSNVDIHDDSFLGTNVLRQTVTIAENNEECGTIIYPAVRAEDLYPQYCFDIEKRGHYFFRAPNSMACYFLANDKPEAPGTVHSGSHSKGMRAAYLHVASGMTIEKIELSDISIRQVGWERRPQGLDAMLADENYMGSKSHLLRPK